MFMKSDGDFLVLDDTIVLYKGKGPKVVFPAVIDGHRIKTIGNEVVSGRTDIEEIVVERGIEVINTLSFERLPELMRIQLPDTLNHIGRQTFAEDHKLSQLDFMLHLSESEYKELLEDSCGGSEGLRVCGSYIKKFDFYKALKEAPIVGTFMFKPVTQLDKKVRTLVAIQRLDVYRTITTNIDLVGGDSFEFFSEAEVDRNDITRKIALLQKKEYINPDTADVDRYNDQRLKNHEVFREPNTMLPCFHEDNVSFENGEVIVKIEMLIGTFYWNSVRRVVVQGKNYYSVDRYYLTDEEFQSYRRKRSGIYFDENGIEVSDPARIEAIDLKSSVLNYM
ncbi:leucine-rich repeat protein [Butyrivibrio proteoclasticus]|uniref:leucine-rich repeat protein n=1 Tax=Butyrivibrio proteoclasticus TaxID=43305 RepID=UPI000479B2BD|nr:leucine-rich repeat protein [Butyrivibrio proteoclasticus]